MKRFIAIVFLLIAALVSTVSALQVTDVIVNGVEITQDTTVSITRGEDVDIWVQMSELPGVEVKDVKVRAWVEGYEYGDIEDKTDLFDIHASTTPNVISKNLELKLPDDLDATESYTLNIGVFFQSSESIEYAWNFDLLVSPERHKLSVFDVIFNPSDKVRAGDNLYAKIRVENLGDKREENVKVTLSVPQLGVSTSDYIDDLSTTDCSEGCDDNENENTDSAELFIKIPENAKTGIYDAIVKISYGRNNFEEEERYNVFVEEKKEIAAVDTAPGTPTQTGGVVTSVISVDTTSQNVEQGGSAVYKIMFANLGEDSETFSLALEGVNFGTARVDPAFITVAPDKTGEAYVYVSTNEDAKLGTNSFIVKVSANGKNVKDINLVSNVSEKIEEKGISLVGVLETIFIILFVGLIIVGIVLVVKKLRSDDEDTEEPSSETGSYY